MPANSVPVSESESGYFHIFNLGIDNKSIFSDKEDYQTFIGYLSEYLSPQIKNENSKKEFIVKGKVYRGVPHQPKNYFDKVELIAFSLKGNHFHLILKQMEKKALENFLRSLCTRYSIYFNKKYLRNGSLFEGPYKSLPLRDISQIHLLTQFIHSEGGLSSYPEYKGEKTSNWVKPDIVISFDGHKIRKYTDFVEKYKLNQEEKNLLESIKIEKGIIQTPEPSISSQEIHTQHTVKTKARIPEYFAISSVFVILFGLGLINIENTSIQKSANISPTGTSSVLSETTEVTLPDEPSNNYDIETSTEDKKYLTINTGGETDISVRIRQSPSLESEIIGKAQNGDRFEYTNNTLGWYEIVLVDGTRGYIANEYIDIYTKDNL